MVITYHMQNIAYKSEENHNFISNFGARYIGPQRELGVQ